MHFFRKSFFLVLLMLLFSVVVFADSVYFDFTIPNAIPAPDGATIVTIFYDLRSAQKEDFLVRPVVDGGTAYIWAGGSWVSGNAAWGAMPLLTSNIKLRIQGAEELSFQIKEKTNQRIYETPKHRIWSRSVFDNYVTDLNARLALPLEQSIPMVEEAVATSSTARILGQVPAKKNYFFLVVTTFLLSAVLGFFWRRIVNFAVLTANRTTCEPLYEELV